MNPRMQQHSTFYTLMQKNVVVLLQDESADATVQHFLHVDVEKYCGAASKWVPGCNTTVLFTPWSDKVM